MSVDNENKPNKNFTITKLKSAVDNNEIEYTRYSLQRYGLSQGEEKITDYSKLQAAIVRSKTEIAKLLINSGCPLSVNGSDPSHTPLALAVETENEDLTALLLDKQAKLYAGNNGESTLLHLAAQRRSLKMLLFLLRYQLDTNHISNGKTAFQMFLENFSDMKDERIIEIVKRFLEKGTFINFKINNNQTVLHCIIKIRDKNIIQTALQATNIINEQDNDKSTALHTLLNQQYPEQTIAEIVKLLIAKGANLDIQDVKGNTVCHLAAKYNYRQILQIFLLYKWDINCCNQEGNTALHLFLKNYANLSRNGQYFQSHTDTVKLWLLKGAKVDIQNIDGEAAFHIAAKYKFLYFLKIFLCYQWDVNCCDEEGNTVLHLIFQNSAHFFKNKQNYQIGEDIVKKLIAKGTNLDFQDICGNSPCHLAAKNKLLQFLQILLNCQWNVNCCDEESNTVLHLIFQNSANFFKNKQNCEIGEDIVKTLIAKGANLDFQDICGNSPCHLAAKNKLLQFLQILLNYQWNVNCCDLEGNTVLYLLLQNSADLLKNECDRQIVVDIVKLLLLKGAKTDMQNISGDTAFHVASRYKFLEVLKIFLLYECNVNYCDQDGNTGLHLILQNSEDYLKNDQYHQIVTDIVISKGAKLDIQDKYGNTVCHLAAKFKFLKFLQICLCHEWNRNLCNQETNTILHIILQNIAVFSKDAHDREIVVYIIQLLIFQGADINIQNKYGNTAIHLASRHKDQRILHIFLQCEQWIVNCLNREGNSVLHLFLQDSADLCNRKWYIQVLQHIFKQNSIELVKNKEGRSPLHIAAMNKQNKVLNDLLSMPVDLNASDRNGTTVLFIFMEELVRKKNACKEDIDIVKKLISKGSNPVAHHHRHPKEYTPLHFALKLRNKEIILAMLQCSFDFEVFNLAQNLSILHFLCLDKYNFSANFTETEDLDMAEIAEICLKKGASVDAMDRDSRTPLYWAVLMRRKRMVRILLEYGADPNLCDKNGRTILENLMKKEVEMVCNEYNVFRMRTYTRKENKKIPPNIERDSEIAQMLLAKNANAEKVSDSELSIFHYCALNKLLDMLLKIIPYYKNTDIHDSSKNTILRVLLTENVNTSDEVERKVAEIVAILLSKGAQVRNLNKKNETPLHLAAKGKHFKTSKILLENNASVADLDSNGNSVLHYLCMSKSETNDAAENDLAELFISKGCRVNIRNSSGMTPLVLAAEFVSANTFRFLMEHGTSINCTQDEELNMPIHLAAKHNRREIVEHLIQCGVDVNVRRRDRKTPLHLSVINQSSNVTRLLLKKGAVTDLKDNNGKTPLHYACWHESLDNVNELLDYGADLNAEDNFGATPLNFNQLSNNTWTKLHYHAVKSRIAKMPVSQRNENAITMCMQETNYVNTTLLRRFEQAAAEEILKMKKYSIAVTTTLADVLQMSANKLSLFKCNEDFQKLLKAKDFKEKYPIYADLVKACYRKGSIRNDLMLSAKVAFRKILGLPLPDICCDTIFHYLDHENLHKLNEAAKIRISKRKRFLDEIEHNIPAKRIRRLSV